MPSKFKTWISTILKAIVPDRSVTPLRTHLWRSYLQSALIPLLVIELTFVAVYWVSSLVVFDRNMGTAANLSRLYFSDIAARESGTIRAKLEAVASHTRVFSQETLAALEGSNEPPPSERDRYIIRPEGGLYTRADEGRTSSFLPKRVTIGPNELNQVLRLSTLEPLMQAITQSNPDVTSIYFNSFESFNIIYPAIDQDHYSNILDVRLYNFYNDADAENNPERRDIWTDAYVDPAGSGWIVSSIAPVWRGDRLEGVVGIDVTLDTIIDSILDMDLPWGGYAVLIDQNGGIIALPGAAEQDFGLSEMSDFEYSEAILADIFKPDDFNINLRDDTRPLAAAMEASSDGEVELQLGGERLASFATVPQTGWKLVIIAPTDNIFAAARALRSQMQTVGYVMIALLLVFYLLFFAFLAARARMKSELVAKPLIEISGLIENIGEKDLELQFEGSRVLELDRLGKQLLHANRLLQSAENETDRQTRIAQDALVKLRAANDEMVIFARIMSHQIRTPLSVIDSSAQMIQRKAENLAADELRNRAARLRGNVAAIADLLSSLVARFDTLSVDLVVNPDQEPTDLRLEVARLAGEMIAPERVILRLPDDAQPLICATAAYVAAIRQIIANAALLSQNDAPIEIVVSADEAQAYVTVSIDGNEIEGISENFAAGTDAELKRSFIRRYGIGLNLARKAVVEAGGKLEFATLDYTSSISLTIPRKRRTR